MPHRLTQEPVEFFYGTTDSGYRLLTRGGGEVIIESHSWRTWADVAQSVEQTWIAFVHDHREQLAEWSDQKNGGRPVAGCTRVDAADTRQILNAFIGSPEAWAVRRLFDEVGFSARVIERLASFATFWSRGHGVAYEAIRLASDEAIAGFQRVLDEEGFSRIRLTRDDEFFRRIYPRLTP